jgi:hypothetical protein
MKVLREPTEGDESLYDKVWTKIRWGRTTSILDLSNDAMGNDSGDIS